MLRSEINAAIERAKSVLRVNGFHLPPFAFWTPEEWRRKGEECDEIRACKLGWDVTDFASGDFAACRPRRVHDSQRRRCAALSPHRLLRKGDDRRRGPAHADALSCDQAGRHHLPRRRRPDLPGLQPRRRRPPRRQRGQRVARRGRAARAGGASLRCSSRRIDPLTPALYHEFYAEPGTGTAIVGEVSSVNDDASDNLFLDAPARFPAIVEDEPPTHLLCNEY